LATLQLLIKQRHISPDYEVPCRVISYERAQEISLTENSGREAMHPADRFEAFKALIDAGQSVEDVAARFVVSSVVVQRRLKLANICPDFIQLYGEGKITLEVLMVFALTDDHAKRKSVWKGLREHERHPSVLRRLLTENEISVRESSYRHEGAPHQSKTRANARGCRGFRS
jgi:ParB family transcriptional regulator, chromosome partitioning protein